MANYFNMSIKTPYGRELNLFDKDEPYTRCHIPFTQFVIKQHDEIGPCWFHAMGEDGWNKFAGFKIEDFDKAWQSEKFKNFRHEVIKGNTEYCKNCYVYNRKETRFVNDFLLVDMFDYYGKKVVNSYKFQKDFNEEYPYTLELSFDLSCNVKCKTCRDDYILDYKIDESIIKRIIEYAKHCRNLIIGGDGEIFYSKSYMEILGADLSGSSLKSIVLMTNGLLLNEKNWNKIHPNNRKLIKVIKITLDSTNKETYEMLREGSKWDVLMKNFEFIKQLKKDYKFKLHSNFTISKWNYKEIIDFPKIALDLGFDLVLFSYADQEFRKGQELENIITVDPKTRNECEEIVKMLIKEYKDKGLQII